MTSMSGQNQPNTGAIQAADMSDFGIFEQFTEVKLLERRKIFISEPITPKSAKKFITDLLVLEANQPGEAIYLYINSPGGDVNSGFAIYDTIRFIESPVKVINTGLCASIATIINIAADKQHRFAMPNSRFLIHQPLIPGQIYGQASDLEITAREILKIREKINKLISEETGQPLEKVEKDTVRDYWMNAQEAHEYGLVTKIVEHAREVS